MPDLIGNTSSEGTYRKPAKKKPSVGSVAGRTLRNGISSARRSVTRGRSSGSGNRSSGRSSGRSGVSNRNSGNGNGNSGNSNRSYSPPPKPKPKPPSINSYLGTDSTYQGAVRGGKRSLADFLSDLGRRRGEAGTQFTQTKGSMERDRVTQLEDLRNEFASRGLIQSGLYGEEQGKFQSKFTEQNTALEQQQAALLADLLGQEKNYRRESDLALEVAKQEALQRRAAKFKIGA